MRLQQSKTGFVFTGWHMATIMVAFFGVIISVNMLMAYFATSTWSGLVVPNTYVASQQFNGKAAAIRDMLATGIKGKLTVTGGDIRYSLSIADEGPVVADTVTAHFKRPVGEHQDFVVALQPAGNGDYVASHPVLPGHWIVEMIAMRDGEIIMHEANRIAVIEAKK
ncbi:FixH family protein [Ciceribacter sp. L1K22]|uniref:FixH family protein n=1 Tax=Ciceribacter sp. L1K22 TaxID=2820275 RepID=UPI001ABE6140|nr:FixH family protein [Ciceribacter sp. L1K22]MBO3760520.1 FixH family protein [Ciceribacter sp. L1K22]